MAETLVPEVPAAGTPAPRTPWWRRPVAWAAGAAALVGLALGLTFGVFAAAPASPTPVQVLTAGGYTSMQMTLNHAELARIVPAQLAPYVTSAAVGVRGNPDDPASPAETVFGLNPAGVTLITAAGSQQMALAQAALPKGAHLSVQGSNMIATATVGEFNAAGS